MCVEWKIKGLFPADAQIVYDEIISIGDEFTPEAIVQKARNEKTELHKCFEWDDTVAAHKYRLKQAGDVVRCLVAKNETVCNKELPQTRMIVSTNRNDGTYEPVTVTIRNKDSYTRLLEEAIRELTAFERKYAIIKELEVIISDIEELLSTS